MILNHLKRLSKHSLIYAAGNISTKALAFFLIPIYTRYLTTADYGIIETLRPIGSVLGIVYTMGLTAAVTRYYFEYEEAEERKRYFGTILIFIVPTIFAATILLDTFGAPLFGAISKGITFEPYIRLTVWTSVFLVVPGFPVALFLAREESIKYVILQLSRSLLTISSIIYFVVVLKSGALGKIKGELYVSVFLFIVCFIIMSKNSRISFSGAKLGDSLRFGLPLTPHKLANWVINLSDRLILQRYSNLSNVGIYSLGYNIGMIMQVIVISFNNAWAPFLFSTAKSEKNAPEIFSRITTYYLAGILFLSFALSLFSREIVVLMTTPKFYDAYKVIPIIVLSYAFQGVYLMLTNQIFYSKKTGYLPFLTGLAAATNIGLNFLLIPKIGMMGAAYATLFSFIVWALSVYVVSSRVYPIKYEKRRILVLFCVFVTFFLVRFFFTFDLTLWNVLSKTSLTIMFPIALFFLGFFTEQEKQKIRDLYRNIRNRM